MRHWPPQQKQDAGGSHYNRIVHFVYSFIRALYSMKPACICSFATNSCLYDMKVFLLSLSYSNPGSTVVIFVDTDVKAMVESLDDLKLNLTMICNLDSYSNKNRQQLERQGTWSLFQMTKAALLDYCLATYPDALFLDSDIFVINEIEIPDSCELALSPHYISEHTTRLYGYYNGGCVWTNNKTMPEKWRMYTKKSRFHDQASLEDCAKIFTTKVFDSNHNLSWWREDLDVESYYSVDQNNIYYKNRPIIFVHTHFNNDAYKKFNDLIRNMLRKCESKRNHADVLA